MAGLGGEREWSALAGGVVQIRRERALLRELLRVRACGGLQGLLLSTDGLSSYPEQALKVFGEPPRTGKRGRPRLLMPEGLMVPQALKRYARRRVTGVVRRVVRATEEALRARPSSTQGGKGSVDNTTAYVERLQATFCSRLLPLVRKTRGGTSEGDA